MNMTARNLQFKWSHPIHEVIRSRALAHYETDAANEYKVHVDFDLAAKMIELRPDRQRPLDPKFVKQYARQMRSGGFKDEVVGAFVFDARGRLIDGQHRCGAVLECAGEYAISHATVRILKYDAETNSLPVDGHKPRSRRDHERWIGLQVPKSVSAGLLYEHFGFRRHQMQGFSHIEQAEIIKSSPILADIQGIRGISRAPAGLVAAAARCVRANRDAVRFFECVMTNEHVIDNEHSKNIALLATWLVRLTAEKRSYSGDNFIREVAFRGVSAWNDHRRGKRPMILPKYSVDAEIPEALP